MANNAPSGDSPNSTTAIPVTRNPCPQTHNVVATPSGRPSRGLLASNAVSAVRVLNTQPVLLQQEEHDDRILLSLTPSTAQQTGAPRLNQGTYSREASSASAYPHHESCSRVSLPTHQTKRDSVLQEWLLSENLDIFYSRVYNYYLHGGLYPMLLFRTLNLITLSFTIFFTVYLMGCVDIWNVHQHKTLRDSIKDQCWVGFHWFTKLMIIGFIAFLAVQGVKLFRDLGLMIYFKAFYNTGLGIADEELQSISWESIVEKMADVASGLPESPYRPLLRVNAKEMAHRLMRQDNYLIAMINKDILNLSVHGFSFFTLSLEWTLRFTILDYVFDSRHNLRRAFLNENYRNTLKEGLERRFFLTGLASAFLAPAILVWMAMHGMFKYGEEIYRRPATLSLRRYTPLAQWQIREFNELKHEFFRRIRQSYGCASQYLDEFSNLTVTIVASFVTYLAGSVFIVLTIMTLLNGDLLMNFELTEGKSVFFYLSVFGTIAAVSRSMIPAEGQVPDPAKALRKTIRTIHYCPPSWRKKFHSRKTRRAFASMYQYRVINFAHELLGVIMSPYLCFTALPECAGDVVDFFREFTKYDEKVGYVCSFADFDFKKHGRMKFPVGKGFKSPFYLSKNGKMEQSFVTFMRNNPKWQTEDATTSPYTSQNSKAAQPGRIGCDSDGDSSRSAVGCESDTEKRNLANRDETCSLDSDWGELGSGSVGGGTARSRSAQDGRPAASCSRPRLLGPEAASLLDQPGTTEARYHQKADPGVAPVAQSRSTTFTLPFAKQPPPEQVLKVHLESEDLMAVDVHTEAAHAGDEALELLADQH